MAQTTSVNANNSLHLRRASGLPVGAFTVTLQGRFSAWSGNANQNIILVEGPSGQGQIYANLSSGHLLVWTGSSGATLYNATTELDEWGMFYMRRVVGVSYRYGFVIGGVAYEVTGSDLGAASDVQVLGLTFAGSNQANQLHGCSFSVWSGYLTDAELLAQALSDSPIDTSGGSGATVNGWVPMASAATVGTATVGTNATVSGTGADVTDSPYSSAHELGANDLVAGTPALGTAALGQAHAVGASGLTGGTPELGSPALGTLASLGATDLAAGAPQLGSAALGQAHALVASDLMVTAPLLGAAALNNLSVDPVGPIRLVSVSEQRLIVTVSPQQLRVSVSR
jgi:hypothetical protein